LPHLPIRRTKGKKPLIDYFQSHVVINFEYLDILKRKVMKKATIEEIGVGKRKDKEDMQVKQVAKLGFAVEQTTQTNVEKCARA